LFDKFQPECPDKVTSETTCCLLADEQRLVVQRKWLVFELKCGSTGLALYECTQAETEYFLS